VTPDRGTPRTIDDGGDEPAVPTRFVADAYVGQAWEDHAAELYTFLRRATRDEAAAEDLLQDAFLRLTTAVGTGRPPEQVRAWLYTVAANLATSRGRRMSTAIRWMHLHGQREARPATVESPESRVMKREGRVDLEAALSILAPDARTALLLSRDGFTGLEIAEVLGRSHAATRTMLSRARVQVRLELERRGAVE
jgi:RNA polymerase sigma-70 factor (ECF subfamily)